MRDGKDLKDDCSRLTGVVGDRIKVAPWFDATSWKVAISV